MKTVFVAAAAALGLASGPASAVPPGGLAEHGRVLWNFEALLHDTFGERTVCTRNNVDFVSGSCTPLAIWSSYDYVFEDARHSAFHLVAARPKGTFGNYPQLLRVQSKYLACDRGNHSYVVRYADAANFALDCLAPS